MEKEVLIHVKGLHMMDTPEGDEPIEIVVPGEYYFRNGSHYLRYEEMPVSYTHLPYHEHSLRSY